MGSLSFAPNGVAGVIYNFLYNMWARRNPVNFDDIVKAVSCQPGIKKTGYPVKGSRFMF